MDEEKIVESEVTESEVSKPKYDRSPGHIRQLHAKGNTYKEIAERLGTTEQNVKNIVYIDGKKKAEAEANKKPRGRPKGSKNKRTLAEEKMLAHWENSPLSPMMREDKADLNRAAGYFVGECWKMGQNVNHDDIESMYQALWNYVALCTQTGMPMLVKTCHLALGLNASTVGGWRSGKNRSSDPRYKEFIQVMDAVVAAGIEAAGAAGSLDRVLTIWFEKAHFGLYEREGLVVENTDPLGEKKTPKQIVEQYSELLPEDN